MENYKEIQSIINMIKVFISGDDCSLQMAGAIETVLDDLFPEDDEIQDFVTYFAMYRPGGGEYIFDENRMKNECKKLIEILRARYGTLSY